jgi:hypothetical protein
MKLGKFDSLLARNRAAHFLTASIGEMHQLMINENIDFVYSGDNPHQEQTVAYNAFRMMSSNYSSLEALKHE